MSDNRPTLAEGFANAKQYEGKKVVDVLDNISKRNKGSVGGEFEKKIGIPKSSERCDYIDGGDFKTLKFKNNNPAESCDIIMLQEILHEAMNNVSFYESAVYEKIQQVHFAPINKDGEIDEWTFGKNFVISKETHPELYKQFEVEYDRITRNMRALVNSGKHIGATEINRGRTNKYLEIRPKGQGGGKSKNTWNGVVITKPDAKSAYSYYFKEVGLKSIYNDYLTTN
jgi:hypothetical protein